MNLISEINSLIPERAVNIEDDNNELIVSMTGDTYSGHLLFMHIELCPVANILSYSVAHEYRGTGLGSKLYDIFERYLISRGHEEIKLHLVLTGAEKFWSKKGFTKHDHVWSKKIC